MVTSQINEQMFVAYTSQGLNCYVLCGSTFFNPGFAEDIDSYNACFVIDDVSAFANAISTKLPFFKAGYEGSVIYQDNGILERDPNEKMVSDFVDITSTDSPSLDKMMDQAAKYPVSSNCSSSEAYMHRKLNIECFGCPKFG